MAFSDTKNILSIQLHFCVNYLWIKKCIYDIVYTFLSTQNIMNITYPLFTKLKFIKTNNINPTNSVKSWCKIPTQRRLAPGTRRAALSYHLKTLLGFEDATHGTDTALLEWLPRGYAPSFLVWWQFPVSQLLCPLDCAHSVPVLIPARLAFLSWHSSRFCETAASRDVFCACLSGYRCQRTFGPKTQSIFSSSHPILVTSCHHNPTVTTRICYNTAASGWG